MFQELLSHYRRWVVGEQHWLFPLLDSARGFTIFLPGRFSAAELQAEGIYSGLNLLALFHDRLIDRPRPYTCELEAGPQRPLTRKLQNLLLFFHYSEVFFELAASRKFPGQKNGRGRWLVILFIEIIKFAARYSLLLNNSGRLLKPATQESLNAQANSEARKRALEDPVKPSGDPQEAQRALAEDEFRDLLDVYVARGRGEKEVHGRFSYEAAQQAGNLNESLGSSGAGDEKSRTAARLEFWSEILHFLRPVIYVAAIIKYSKGRGISSWRPLLLSALVDAVSRMMIEMRGRLVPLSESDRAELSRRFLAYFFYFLRSPLFESFTRHPIERLGNGLGRIPLLGGFFSSFLQLAFAIQKHYFYTSAS